MLTQDDIKNIGVELGKVIEDNITPALDELHTDVKVIQTDVKDIKTRLTIVEINLIVPCTTNLIYTSAGLISWLTRSV